MTNIELAVENLRNRFSKIIALDEEKRNAFLTAMLIITQENKNRFGTEYPDWGKMSIKEKTYHGWLLNMILPIESGINGRWPYWLDIMETLEVEGKDIPQIRIYKPYEKEFKLVSKMLKECLNPPLDKELGLRLVYLFVDWLLYGLGCSTVKELPLEITDELNQYWYEKFMGDLMVMFPGDYFVPIITQLYQGFNANAFYPTSGGVVQATADIQTFDIDKELLKYTKVYDPTMGSGTILLYMSNKSLRLYSQDKDELMVKLAYINGYFYIPWLVCKTKEVDKLLNEMYEKYSNNRNKERA